MISSSIDRRNRRVFTEATVFRSPAEMEAQILSLLYPGEGDRCSAVVFGDRTIADTIHARPDSYDEDIDAWANGFCRSRPLKWQRYGSDLLFERNEETK